MNESIAKYPGSITTIRLAVSAMEIVNNKD
jgi:hypothetical protein